MDTLRRMDAVLLLCLLCLAALGLTTLYAAVHQGGLHLWHRQILYWLAGMAGFLAVCFAPLRLAGLLAWPAYALALLALALVPLAGEVQMGARRWLSLGVIHMQPSELMKWALMLALAHWFASRDAASLRNAGVALALIAAPAAFIVMQPDLGTALVLAAAGAAMLVAAGMPWRWALYGMAALAAMLPLVWRHLHDYQRQRVLTFLDPQSDPLGAGYHVIQSMIAIGSGGIFGKGFLHGTQARLHFLPEQHTDFIFAVLAEEGGFVAAAVLLLLYVVMISRILAIARRAATRFGSLICVGVATIFTLYATINIGMVTGVLPVVGVPLPFISYGGSALLTMLLALGLVMRVAIESKGRVFWQRPGSPLA